MDFFSQVIYENGCEHLNSLQSPMKMVSESNDMVGEIFSSSNKKVEIMNNSSNQFSANDHNNIYSTSLSKDENGKIIDKQNTKEHFVEIGEFSCGSIFGLGEHMKDRVIVAKHSEVQCLIIPHYWLFQKKQNAGNIWQR